MGQKWPKNGHFWGFWRVQKRVFAWFSCIFTFLAKSPKSGVFSSFSVILVILDILENLGNFVQGRYHKLWDLVVFGDFGGFGGNIFLPIRVLCLRSGVVHFWVCFWTTPFLRVWLFCDLDIRQKCGFFEKTTKYGQKRGFWRTPFLGVLKKPDLDIRQKCGVFAKTTKYGQKRGSGFRIFGGLPRARARRSPHKSAVISFGIEDSLLDRKCKRRFLMVFDDF